MTVELNPRQKHAMKTMKRYRRTIVTGYLASGKTTVLMEFAKKWSKKNSGGRCCRVYFSHQAISGIQEEP
jgi:superfamily II DNA or RNA helicase